MENVRNIIAIGVTKVVAIITKNIMKRGTSLPGMIGLKISPNILKYVCRNMDIVFITGTNGKTTTTSLVTKVLEMDGIVVVTNGSGANMLNGIATTLIYNYKLIKKDEKRIGVIEIDEANVRLVTKYITPKMIVVTNLFRDQLDRYGEVYTTLKIIEEGINKKEIKLLLNGDDPMLGNVDVENEKIYFGFDMKNDTKAKVNIGGKFCTICKNEYSYKFISYNHLGDYYCDKCGHKRPMIKYSINEVVEMTENEMTIKIENELLNITLTGMYNSYNVLCAYGICRELGIKKEKILEYLEGYVEIKGRHETIKIGNKDVVVILVKNPAGYNEALMTVKRNENSAIVLLLNDDYVDSRDISWIWDVDFEEIVSDRTVLIGGKRKYDMAVRLKIAGFNRKNFIFASTNSELIEKIKKCREEKVYILATYTAMTSLRKYLFNNKYITTYWE